MSGLEKDTHGRIQVRSAEAEQDERRLLDLLAQRSRETARVAKTVIALGSVLSIVLVSLALIVIHRDFAARRHPDGVTRTRHEKLRIATEQADPLTAAFLATISHELRLPLNSITSYAMVGDHKHTLAAGCSGYLEKPLDPDTFVDEISRYLRTSG